jgi:hypothetical protein
MRLIRGSGGDSAFVDFTQSQLQERLANMDIEKIESKGDFLSKLLSLHADNPEKVTMADVFMACMTNIGAGSDTTGLSLSAVIYYLCKNPEVMRKLREEIDCLAKKGEISDPVTYGQAQNMPYLQAVLKEAFENASRNWVATWKSCARGRCSHFGKDVPSWSLFSVFFMPDVANGHRLLSV